MIILRKYGVATHVYVPIVKRAVVDFAVGADWTPAAGDVKISKDGGAAANVTNLPTAIVMGNTAVWDFNLTATELQAAKVVITVSDSATKAVEDQTILLDTYGNAAAEHAIDLDDSVRAGLTALPNAAAEAAGGLYTRGAGAGQINQNANGQVDTRWVAGNVTVGTNNDKAGYALSAAGVQAIWDALTSALTTVGSIGKLLVDNINATISSRSSHTAADVWASATRTLTSFGTFAQDVWDKLTTALTTVGSIGKLIVDNLNAAITSRAAAGDAMALTVAERGSVADKLLGRTRGGGADGGRTVAECLAFGRNKWAISGGILTVYQDDDTTPLYTAAVTTAAGDPVTSVDPV